MSLFEGVKSRLKISGMARKMVRSDAETVQELEGAW